MLSLKWDICITPPSPKIQGSLWKSKEDFKSERWWVTTRNDDEETVVSGQLHTGAHSAYDNMHKTAQALKPDKPNVESEVNRKSHPWLRP